MTIGQYNIIVVSMIPALVTVPGVPWDVLPPGIHVATLAEVEQTFALNSPRRHLLGGLITALDHLALIGCRQVFLDGSYVTAKPIPGDYDACWDPVGVDFDRLDPVFDDFDNGRENQKKKFGGEFFPSSIIEAASGASFVEFFQIEKHTGVKKGILSIPISLAVARRTGP